MQASSTSGVLSGKLYCGILDKLPDHPRTHTQHLLARSHQLGLKRKLRDTGAPSIRPPSPDEHSHLFIGIWCWCGWFWGNPLYIQTLSRKQRVIRLHKRGHRTFVCGDGCLIKKVWRKKETHPALRSPSSLFIMSEVVGGAIHVFFNIARLYIISHDLTFLSCPWPVDPAHGSTGDRTDPKPPALVN